MISIAKESLKDIVLPQKAGFTRYIKRVPLGVVFVIAPWNYPYLCMVNSIIPVLLAGNTVKLIFEVFHSSSLFYLISLYISKFTEI